MSESGKDMDLSQRQAQTPSDRKLAEHYSQVLKLRAELRTAQCGRALKTPFPDVEDMVKCAVME